jgi:hypothetical protein
MGADETAAEHNVLGSGMLVDRGPDLGRAARISKIETRSRKTLPLAPWLAPSATEPQRRP